MRGLFLLLTLALLLITTISLSCGQEPDTVRIGTDGEYPPYNFVNDAGEVDGFEREMADEICRRADLECEWIINPWGTIIDNLLDNQYDAIISGMSINSERDEVIDFTQPYLPPTPSVYVALLGAPDDALNGIVAAGLSTVHSAHLAAIGTEFVEFDVAEEAVVAILNGDVDAGLFDRGFGQTAISESGGKLVVIGQPVLLEEGIGAGVRETDADLKDKLNAAIKAMKQDGSLNELIRKWFDEDAELF